MKRTLLFATICFFCSFISSAQEYLELQKKAEEFYNKNQFVQALNTCEKALKLAEENVGGQHVDYAFILGDLGVYKVAKTDIAGGLADLLKAEKLIQSPLPSTKSVSYIMLLNNIASVYMEAGMGEDAGKYFQKAIDYKKELKQDDDLEYANLLGSLAQIQVSVANYKEAELNLLRSKKIFDEKKADNIADYGSLLNNMASFYHDLTNYGLAEKYYKSAAKVYLKTDGEFSENYASCMQNNGELFSDIGAYAEAEKYFLRAKEIKAKVFGEVSYPYATILNDMAYLYHHNGEYAKSEDLYLKTLKLKSKILGEKHESYLRTKQNLAMLYYMLGRAKVAEKMLEEVIEKVSITKKEDALMYTDYIENLGCVYTQNKKFVPAEKLLKEALESYKTIFGENHPEYLRALNNLAALYSEKGELKEAKKTYEMCINVGEKVEGNQLNLVTAYTNMGDMCKREKQYEKSLEYHTKAFELCKKTFNPLNLEYLHSQFEMANAYSNMNKDKEAEEFYIKVLDAEIERLQRDFLFMTEAEKVDFTKKLNFRLNNFYAFVYKRQETNPIVVEKLFDYRLATKAMLLNSQEKSRRNILQSKDTSLQNNYAELKKIRNYLSKLYSFSNDDILATKVNVDSLQKVASLLEKKVSLVASINKEKKVTWKDIQKKLDKNEVAIEIIRTDSIFYGGHFGYCAMLVSKTKSAPNMFFIPDETELEERAIAEYRKNIRSKAIDTVSFNRFYKMIYDSTRKYTKVYFSGDGVYNQLNINTLLDPKSGNYMAEVSDISLLTNLKDMLDLNDKKDVFPKGSYAALFGFPDYGLALKPATNFENESLLALNRAGARGSKWTLPALPGTKVEVEEINKVLNANKITTKLFLADRSDEGTVKKMKNPFVLHIATHGFFEANIPNIPDSQEIPDALKRAAENPLLRSGIMFAGASNSYSTTYSEVADWDEYEDGILTAYEVMNLDLDSTELVVLSACQTGLGEIKNGEGVYGLQRAFMIAGAKTIIMSLWSVSDNATRDLMISFYDKWLLTGNKQLAFKEAQLELRKKYIHPYYWGAFVLLEK